ncbi:MAG: phosphate acyltransferase PlsX [Planctomycetes bacterium]|nr:phosphate acyltransferase PlsX [Planctomycetota bacterium]
MIRIGVDAMGGDNAPLAIIEGAIRALKEGFAEPGEILLVGREDEVPQILHDKGLRESEIGFLSASQVVGMDETPVDALRRKPDSSIVKTLALVKEQKADAMISAGNTGAVVAGSIFLLGMLEGIKRPGIGVLFDTLKGPCTLIDVGANVNCKPIHLFQYGWMASNYMKYVLGIEKPKICMINIGEETKKGTSLLHETRNLFENSPMNFAGNIEGQDLFIGKCDVVVCDGFVGNVILKVSEGLGTYFQTALKETLKDDLLKTPGIEKNTWQKAFHGLVARLDYAEYGGAPLLGVNGNVFICHGRSNPRAISNAIRVARISIEQKVNEQISTGLENV